MASPNPKVRGPGLLYVTSRIDRTDLLDEKTYFKWYDDDHIDEIVQTSGMKSAFRYRDANFDEKNKNKEKVYLAFYPMQDLAFTQGDEFRNIRVKSDMLPGSGIIYDLADLDVRYLGLVHKTEPKQKRDHAAPCLVVFGVEPGDGTSEKDVEKWFKEEHIPAASKVKGHNRSTLYHLQYARTNAQSRALKGLPTSDAPAPAPPTWLAVHELDDVVDMLSELESTPGAKRILGEAKQVERVVYKLARALGSEEFFD
ncbi:uncharacterized protein LTR77_000682 [Saxophila tyrrhenica]|uniref:Uncharacterized protein n=1 Tax=Saxophila tyrrhenica TaxID=1690608 RepID=A0AAV9PT72_9PEZI|nr:hypothetical protein LTR77_000682 [Saxophila tyrrhenica]